MKRSTLARRSPLRQHSPLKRATAHKPTRVSPASPEQRAKVKGRVCVNCGGGSCDPAHLTSRAQGGCDHSACVLPLCRQCHRSFDEGRIDLEPVLALGEFSEERSTHGEPPITESVPEEVERDGRMSVPMLGAYRVYRPEELEKDGYPWTWHERLKHEVREDAGNRCVRCGHPYAKGAGEWSPCDERCTHDGPIRYRFNESGKAVWCDIGPIAAIGWSALRGRVGEFAVTEVQARWRILTVHHLDGSKANCRWWNLVALCQRCHLQIQGKVQMKRVWPWEHSEWFRPYVAGYYASVYLGDELTRPEVETRLDELLALERMA